MAHIAGTGHAMLWGHMRSERAVDLGQQFQPTRETNRFDLGDPESIEDCSFRQTEHLDVYT
jgi:hypothetical protein